MEAVAGNLEYPPDTIPVKRPSQTRGPPLSPPLVVEANFSEMGKNTKSPKEKGYS